MKELKGKVIEVFIPKEDNIDILKSTKIGFKVITNEGVKEIIEEQDNYNVNILREDMVILREQIIDNHNFIDIEKLEEEYE